MMVPSPAPLRFSGPVLVAGAARAFVLGPNGEAEALSLAEAARRARGGPPPLVCHLRALAGRLRCDPFPAFDILELFAFVRPASFCLPTPRGIARALRLPVPATLDQEPHALLVAAGTLLREIEAATADRRGHLASLATAMARGGWSWSQPIMAIAGPATEAESETLAVWRRLPAWEERPPEPPPASEPVEPSEARARLSDLLGPEAEDRPQQGDYASAASAAFAPRVTDAGPEFVLAEAGTGTGKTLGYLAPASVWAEKNGGTVWISTYTRNLQHQIDHELDRLFPDPETKRARVVVRKGRENYLCLLNLEEAASGLAARPANAVAAGLMVRFAEATRDGDMVGGDFPAWLAALVGRNRTLGLADQRGECIYAACPHYQVCFIEHSIRRARRAEIVIANHALVMIQAAFRGLDEPWQPLRYVFDEGHHVFDAADSAFAQHLSGGEMSELRRWLRGAEDRRGSRARGLKARIADLIANDGEAEAAVDAALSAAAILPGDGWLGRVQQGLANGPAEHFLAAVRAQLLARSTDSTGPYSLEADCRPPTEDLLGAARTLEDSFGHLAGPLADIAQRLARKLADEAANLDPAARRRIEALARGLVRRGTAPLAAWQSMLRALAHATPPESVDWLRLERVERREIDVGLFRHWRDPTRPFAEVVAKPAHGVLITSATLRDQTGDTDADWAAAEARTGATHLGRPAYRALVPSPFDYPALTRIFVVTDLDKRDTHQLAAAYRELFLAAGGGALGLFTAIERLRAVHRLIALPLDRAGIPLLAQHVDALDVTTLIDIFREEETACLLGTDAVRDGVDVPGPSLRLIVFDRVPWPRPDILHRARKTAFPINDYDDMITRLRLRQAFGRLVRKADDHGVFVLLDKQLPSRLLGAFPAGVEVRRIGIAETIRETRAFLTAALARSPRLEAARP